MKNDFPKKLDNDTNINLKRFIKKIFESEIKKELKDEIKELYKEYFPNINY